jgi:hypothetical protein
VGMMRGRLGDVGLFLFSPSFFLPFLLLGSGLPS